MKKNTNAFLTLILALIVQLSFAQQREVSGTVIDEDGLPLPGVNIILKDTKKGGQTDFDGNYKIEASPNDILIFSYVGYKTTEKKATTNNINVTLITDVAKIDEVVITAAYDIKRTKPTSNASISAISAETIESRPNASLVQTLQGQVAGLNINTNSGQPGADSEINLRGVGSVTGNAEPLFIIDGIPVDDDNFRSMNPNEIASISILKDAGATAIYGNRGANGVVIITTKRGKYNSNFQVNYSNLTSISALQGHSYDLMNSRDQLTLERNMGKGRGAGITDAELDALVNFSDTNWIDVFFRNSMTQSHTLSLTSGGENINSFTSLGYYDQEGILKNSSLQRFNIRNNLNGKSKNDKFDYGTTLSINFSKSDEPSSIGSGSINQNYVLGAYQSVPYKSPSEYISGKGGDIPVVFSNTPLFLLDKLETFTRNENEIKLLGSINAGYKFTDNISYKTRLSSDFTEEQRLTAQAPNSFNSLLFAEEGNDTPGYQAQNSTRVVSFNFVNSINYSKLIKEKHQLDAGFYTEYYKSHYRRFGFVQNGLDIKTFYPGDGGGFINDNADNDFFANTVNANMNDAGLFSYFTNLDYDFDKKYGFGFTLRRDASYRFSKSNRWGTFYSLSGRWNIDQEKFMENTPFNLLKLRASYGTAGNQNIVNVNSLFSDFSGANLTLNLYNTGNGYAGKNAIFPSQIANPDLKWETITQGNIGLDFEVFRNRFSGSLDFYRKITTDLYQPRIMPSYTGTTSIYINNGELKNSGVDLNLGLKVLSNPDGLNLKLNFAGNYNKQERFGADDSTIKEGGKLFEYYTIRYAGVNPANGNLLFLDKDGNLTETPDQDKDRVFTNKNRYPDYQGSFGLETDYKNFTLSTQFNYAVGVHRFDFDYSGFIDPNAIGQFRHSRDILRHWTPDNRVTDIPSLNATNLNVPSDRFLQKADYLRLRFINVGYNFNKEMLNNVNLNSFKLFMNAENLLTFSGWRGFDAETPTISGASNANTYPTPRTLSIGLEIGF